MAESLVRVGPAGPDQTAVLAGLLSEAFFPDPLWLALLPDEAERRRALPLFFGHLLRIGFRHGEPCTARFFPHPDREI